MKYTYPFFFVDMSESLAVWFGFSRCLKQSMHLEILRQLINAKIISGVVECNEVISLCWAGKLTCKVLQAFMSHVMSNKIILELASQNLKAKIYCQDIQTVLIHVSSKLIKCRQEFYH
jgi:hypothetical protein